jgi:LigD-like primase-polymerase
MSSSATAEEFLPARLNRKSLREAAQRRGKVFADFLCNQRGATAIASYSSRAKAGATVAEPLAWNELSTRTTPSMYNIKRTHAIGKAGGRSMGRFLLAAPIDHPQDDGSVRVGEAFWPDISSFARMNGILARMTYSTHIRIADAVPSIVGSFVE